MCGVITYPNSFSAGIAILSSLNDGISIDKHSWNKKRIIYLDSAYVADILKKGPHHNGVQN